MPKKEYIVTIVSHERHHITVDDNIELDDLKVFEYLDEDSMIESEWVDVRYIDEITD